MTKKKRAPFRICKHGVEIVRCGVCYPRLQVDLERESERGRWPINERCVLPTAPNDDDPWPEEENDRPPDDPLADIGEILDGPNENDFGDK